MSLYKTLISLWKNPKKALRINLKNKISWYKILFLFSCNGIILVYNIIKAEGALKLESYGQTFATIIALLLVGSLFGVLSNLILGFLIKLTGKLWKQNNKLKKIYKALAWSYYPLSISVILIIINIFIARFILLNIDSPSILIISLVYILLLIIQSILSIWHLILLFYGLKITLNLNTLKTVLNYFLAVLIYGIFYYLINYFFYA